jgi:hypothetical protein
MPAPYQTLTTNSTESLYSIFSFANNNLSNGVMMPLVLLAIWIIALVGAISEGRQASRAFIFASFVSAILSIILSLVGLLNPQYMYFSFLLVGAGVIWYKLDNAPGI